MIKIGMDSILPLNWCFNSPDFIEVKLQPPLVSWAEEGDMGKNTVKSGRDWCRIHCFESRCLK